MELVYWIGGLTIGALSLPVVLWALLWDRPRGRRRCPRCWYDLTATGGERCPECGHRPRHTGRLLRTRRRWRWAIAGGAGLVLGVALFETPKVRRHGWVSLAPTTILLMVVPPAGQELRWDPVAGLQREHPISVELGRRQAAERLFTWQWRIYAHRCRVLTARDRWPTGTFMHMVATPPAWMNGPLPVDVVLAGGTPLANIASGSPGPRQLMIYDLRSVSPGKEIKLQWALGSLRFSKRILVVAGLEEAMRPLRGDAIDAAMTEALGIRVGHWQRASGGPPHIGGDRQPPRSDRGSMICATVRLDRSVDPRLADLAGGFNVDLLCDHEVVSTNRIWRPDDRTSCQGTTLQNLWRDDEIDRWQVRIRAADDTVLEDLDHASYWTGELTVPLAAVLAHGGDVFNKPPPLVQDLRRIRQDAAAER